MFTLASLFLKTGSYTRGIFSGPFKTKLITEFLLWKKIPWFLLDFAWMFSQIFKEDKDLHHHQQGRKATQRLQKEQ